MKKRWHFILLTFISLLFVFSLGAQSNKALAHRFLEQSATNFQLSPEDMEDWIITAQHVSSTSKLTHIYGQQRYRGIDIAGANCSVHLYPNQQLFKIHNNFVSDLKHKVVAENPKIDAGQAVVAGAKALGLEISKQPTIKTKKRAKDQAVVFAAENISQEEIPARLIYHQMPDGSLRLAWETYLRPLENFDAWSINVDAMDGTVLRKTNQTLACDFGEHTPTSSCTATHHKASNQELVQGGYRVFPLPVWDPSDGSRQLVLDPDDPIASPFGWHDTDGVEGAEHTITKGNNVEVRYVIDTGVFYNSEGGSSLNFDFPYSSSSGLVANRDAAITNAFYTANKTHDIFYRYGFDEVSGNFQQNNYGYIGQAEDAVFIRVMNDDTSLGECNAYFLTTGDGAPSVMVLGSCGDRDAGLDNIIIVHEYTHGLTKRLVGGGVDFFCFSNAETMSEGWSDWYALMLTMKPDDTKYSPRYIGEWYRNQTGGIRPFPYSTDLTVNPQTYDHIKNYNPLEAHKVGSVWCSILWEVTWGLIEAMGFDEDLYEGDGGNNIALALVTEALKLTACQPGFVSARDAILDAEMALYGGKYQCILWTAFAKRGLGESALEQSTDDITDGIEAFDTPADLADGPNLPSISGNQAYNFTQLIGHYLVQDLIVYGTLFLNEDTNSGYYDDPAPSSSYSLFTSRCDGDPVTVTVKNGGKIEMGEYENTSMKANFYIGDGSTLHIESGGRLRLVTGSQLVIEEGGKLIIDEGALVDLWWSDTNILIEAGGELVVNGAFDFVGSGFFQFDANHILTLSSNGFTLIGQNDRFIQLNEGATLDVGTHNLTLKNGTVEYFADAKINMGSGSEGDFFAVNFNGFNQGTTTTALKITDPEKLKINYCDFNNLSIGIDISQINPVETINLLGLTVKGCRIGIQAVDGDEFNVHASVFQAGRIGEVGILAADLNDLGLFGNSFYNYPGTEFGALDLTNVLTAYVSGNLFRDNQIAVKLEDVPDYQMVTGLIEKTSASQLGVGPYIGIYVPLGDGINWENYSNVTLSGNAQIKACNIGVKIDKGVLGLDGQDNFGMLTMDCAKLLFNDTGVMGKDITLKIDAFEHCACTDPDDAKPNSFVKSNALFFQQFFDICYIDVPVWGNEISAQSNYWSGGLVAGVDYTLRNANASGLCQGTDYVDLDYSNAVANSPMTCSRIGVPNDNDKVRQNTDDLRYDTETTILISPNPAQQEFNIHMPRGNYQLEIFNALGILMEKDIAFLGDKNIDVSQWPDGLYVIAVKDNLSEKRSLSKLIIQR